MGILNVTPDSFSDGGRWTGIDSALFQAERMIKDGADVIDIGGESTRPGFQPVPAEEEINRTSPVIEKIKSSFDIPVSLDTRKSETALTGIKAGADMINDVWGLRQDPLMAKVIAEADIPCCLMHNRTDPVYDNDLIEDIKTDLGVSLDTALSSGIKKDKIILDPGVGFAKRPEQSLLVIKRLGELRSLGYPLLLGASRKSCVGYALDLPVTERLEGTLVTTVFAVIAGAMFVRVHDVRENFRTVKMAEAILESKRDDS